jgi:rhodanese-related sulfurtransferase
MKDANIISAQDLHELTIGRFPETSIILDIRTPAEHRSEKIKGSINISLDSFDDMKSHIDELKKYKKIYLICATQSRALKAYELLHARGYNNLFAVLGGMSSWKQLKYPLIEGKKIISLTRQVQITAGGLIILGVLCSLVLDARFIYLPGLIGVGLLYTGISGTCLAAMGLSKMPWNK